ncbi:unnamed protein product [Polarella glacialis]|uniref:Uncharacterized protein n=1 Tax=Polarella glacialis TaxID=89957 RepID=A0A813GIJ9_POLGL|nr:unnamed protein product [Polarella glacialis]
MGCSASTSIREERSIPRFSQVVPSHDVRRESLAPPHVNGRKSSHFHKTAAKGGKQPVPAAWQDGEAGAKNGSQKVKVPVSTLWMRTSTPGSAAESPELKSFNEATILPEPTGLRASSSFTFSPGKAERLAGHRLAPCAPTHKRWLKRLHQTLTAWEESPSHLVA